MKQLTRLIAISLALLLSSQSALAMKANNPGRPGHMLDQLRSIISTVTSGFLYGYEMISEGYEVFSEISNLFQSGSNAQDNLSGITFVSSEGDDYTFYAHEFQAIAELSPTIENMIHDAQEIGATEVPLNLVRSRTIELLVRLMKHQEHDVAEMLLDLPEEELRNIYNDAMFLECYSLMKIINEVLLSREAQNEEIPAVDPENIDDDDLSNDDELDEEFRRLFSDIGDLNTPADIERLESLNQYIYQLQGNDLASVLRYVHYRLVRLSATGKGARFWSTTAIDPMAPFPNQLSNLQELARPYCVFYEGSLDEGEYTFNVLEATNKDDRGFLFFQKKTPKELCHFEGPLAEVFDRNENVERLFQILSQSMKNYSIRLTTILNLLESEKCSEKERFDILKTRDLEMARHRIMMLRSFLRQVEVLQKIFLSVHPNLMSAFLVFEFFNAEIKRFNSLYDMSANSKRAKRFRLEQRAFAIDHVSYYMTSFSEIIAALLLPHVNQFLDIIGEEAQSAPQLHEGLRAYARILGKMESQAASVNQKASQPKATNTPRFQAPSTKQRKQPQETKAVTSRKAKRESSLVSNEQPSSLPPPTEIPNVEKTPEVKKERREKNERERKPHVKKTKEERDAPRKRRAAAMVEAYRQERAERDRNFVSFQSALSAENAALVIQGLSQKYQIMLKLVFAQPSVNYILTATDIVNLAIAVQEQMNNLHGAESSAFQEALMDRIHPAHRKDTGDKLPAHYVDLLRMVFILYGVIPEGWEPKTIEDFSAMNKK